MKPKALRIAKWIGIALVTIIVLIMIMIVIKFRTDANVDYDVALGETEVPTFAEIEIPFDQQHDNSTTLPFLASAIIDVDGDGTEEIFIGGARGQEDGLFRFNDGAFVPVDTHGIRKNDSEASHGAAVLDTDGDGDQDLLVSRTDGVWLHTNNGGSFESARLDLDLPDDTTPLGIALADLNRDGHFDMFVSGYIRKDLVQGQNIFNKENYGGSSRLFLNNGDDSFTDITEQAGMTYKHNTFLGVFVDVDEDGFEDLVVAHDTGQVRTWRNNGDLTFTNTPNPNSDVYSYPMGIAVGDYSGDGLVDFFFSNVGSTPPDFLIRGDLRDDQVSNWKWMLFRNDGGFKFSDTANDTRIADYEFSWGAVMEDLNLDGREDLVVSENYVGLPPHNLEFLRLPGRFMVQTETGEFAEVGAEAGVVNRRYSITPLTADFNGDGRPDIVHVNLAGKSLAFISQPGSGNSFKVRLPVTADSIGAKVTVTDSNGRRHSKWFIRGEGLASDNSPVLIFGLGNANPVSVEVDRLNGDTVKLDGPFAGGVLDVSAAQS